jgi:hypothetical protein
MPRDAQTDPTAHLPAAVSMLTKRDVTLAVLQTRPAAAEQETDEYRQRLAKVIQRAGPRAKRSNLRVQSSADEVSKAQGTT